MERYVKLYDKWHENNQDTIIEDKLLFPKPDLNAPILRHSKFHLFSLYILDQLDQFRKWKYSKTVLFLVFVALVLFFEFRGNVLAVILAFTSVLLFYPMSKYDYVGLEFSFSAMIILSSMYGFGVGILMGKVPNLIGHLITHRIDFEFIYELIVFAPIAYVSSLFTLNTIMLPGLLIILLYNAGDLLFYRYSGLLTLKRLTYVVTHCLFNVAIIVNLVPFLLRLGF